jgi:Protein of unknown function (DUF1592)/Protein of unknown function (DUF1588)/Protein of unknown function (DUF1585)
MTRTGFGLGLLLTLAVSVGLIAQSAQELYQRGLVQEHASGDLKQAIALYAQAVQTAGRDRALAAKALIRMAGAHEKLGADAEAASAYAELVRAYPEQRAEVAIAQERLTALRLAARAGGLKESADLGQGAAAERAPDTELAARLATFLWNGAPDALLLGAARHGILHESAELNRQVIRMLRDPKSVGLVDKFFAPWLSLDKLKTARPDPSLYPQFDAELLQAMDTETRLFLQSQLREDRDAVELWTANYTYVNERLGRHYGLSGVSGKEFRRVTWPDANRAGLLGQAALLTSLSVAGRTSPTVRGLFVLTRFLGMDAPSPPANVPVLAERPGTMRDRMMAHKTNPSCASCHALFDPLGLALENFDATGGWRITDGGSPIDASGAFTDGTRFNGPAELRAGLLKYRDAYYAGVTQQLLAYALNRKGKAGRVYDYEVPAVRKIVRDAAVNGYRWSSILAGISASAPFQMKNVVP